MPQLVATNEIRYPTARTKLLTQALPWVCERIQLDTTQGISLYHAALDMGSEHHRQYPLAMVQPIDSTGVNRTSQGGLPVETATLRIAIVDKFSYEKKDEYRRYPILARMDEASVQFMYLLTKRLRSELPMFMITNFQKQEIFDSPDTPDAACGYGLTLTMTLPEDYNNCERLG